MLWPDNIARGFIAAAVNGSARWPILNERRNSIRAMPKSRPISERLIWHCACGRMRSVLNCELSPSIRTTQRQRWLFSSLALTRRAMSTRPGELSMVFQRLLRHSISRRGTVHAAMLQRIIGIWAYLDVIERRFTDAFQEFEKGVVNDDRAHLQQLAGRAALRVLAGQTEAAKSAGEEALPLLEARLRERPDDIFAMTELSWVYLALGRNDDALRLSRQAADSMPIEKDAVTGPYFQNGLAQIEARAGAPEEAIKRLRHLLSIPAGQEVSIARLKIDPVWDPIRNRPDFQQLLSGPEQIGPNK